MNKMDISLRSDSSILGYPAGSSPGSIRKPVWGIHNQHNPLNHHNQQNPHKNHNQQNSHNYHNQQNPHNYHNQHNQTQPINSGFAVAAETFAEPKLIDYKLYICPGCDSPYDFYRIRPHNLIRGKVPLILNCKHTVCEECISRSFKKHAKVQCFVCSEVSPYVISRNFQKTFDLNYYLMGVITCCKTTPHANLGIGLVPTGIKIKNRTATDEDETTTEESQQFDMCGFGNCNKEGTMRCWDCGGTYCDSCCVILHKSGKALELHKTERIRQISALLEKCSEHVLPIEFYCEDCQENACCYCFLDKHEGHTRVVLHRLKEEEEKELHFLKDAALKTLYQLRVTSKKIQNLEQDKMTAVELDIGFQFATLHAQLFTTEKKIREEVQKLKHHNMGLEDIRRTVTKKIAILKELVQYTSQSHTEKLNLRVLLQKLREFENTPCYLLTRQGDVDPMKLKVSHVLENLEELITVEYTEKDNYVLVSSDMLPEDYKIEEMPEISDSESTTSLAKSGSCSSLTSASMSQHQFTSKQKYNKAGSGKHSIEKQPVFITHINSLDNFYIQLKKSWADFEELKKKISVTPKNELPAEFKVNINDTYLSLLACNKNKQQWSRVRVLENVEKDGILHFKVFFIDYGHTKLLTKGDLRQLPHHIAKKKPFAIPCKLDKLSECDWAKDAYLHLAKVSDGKELFITNKTISNGVWIVELNIYTSIGDLCPVTDLLLAGYKPLDSDNIQMKSGTTQSFVKPLLFECSENFVEKSSLDIYLVYVVNPDEVYVQKAAFREKYLELQKTLEKYYKQSQNDFCVPVRGTDMVVKFENKVYGNWHRARIQDVYVEEKKATVFLVDWGRRIMISWTNMRRLTHEFEKIECLAIRVKLADIIPNTDNGQWSVFAIDFLFGYIKNWRLLKMLVSKTNPLEVVLFETKELYDECINAVLVNKQFALSTGDLSKTDQWMHKETKAEEKTLLQDFLPFADQDDDDEIEEDNELVLRIQVEIVRFDSPNLIFIKFVNTREEEAKLNFELQLHYKENPQTQDGWDVADKCVTLYDDLFCRGIIQKVHKNNNCDVYLGDKGVTISAPLEKIYKLDEYFGKFKSLVYKCYIADIKPAGDSGKWSSSSLEWFEQLFKNYKEIYVRKIEGDTSKKLIPVTMLYAKVIEGDALTPSRKKFISVSKKIVRFGLALKNSSSILNLDVPKPAPLVLDDTKPDKMGSSSDESEIDEVMAKASKTPVPIDSFDSSTSEEPETLVLNNITDWKPSLPIKKREFNAHITCAETDGYIYIRDEEIEPIYKEMEAKLKSYFDSLSQSKRTNWHEGQLCTIRDNDYWYRGKILKVKDKNNVMALEIDFGSDHEVHVKNLHHEIMYPDIPTFAAKIRLYNIVAKEGKWYDSDVDNLLRITPEYGKIIIRGNLGIDIPQGDVYDLVGNSLTDLLIAKCPNLVRKIDLMNQQIVIDEEDCIIEEIESISNTSVCEDEEITKDDITWNDIVSSDELAEEQQSSGFRYVELPDSKEKVQMEVICVINHKVVSVSLQVEDGNNYDKFNIMTVDIMEKADVQPQLTDIQLGSACIALYSQDGIWYRALVFNIDGLNCGYVSVFFVDYGNIEIVSCSDIKKIKSEWLVVPVKFFLATIDYHLKNVDHDSLVVKHLTKLTGQSTFVQIIQEQPLKIHIYDQEGKLFYQDFVDNDIINLN